MVRNRPTWVQSGTRDWHAAALLLVCIFGTAGCTTPQTTETLRPVPTYPPILTFQSEDLAIELEGVADADTPGSLIQDAGWLEYRLSLQNHSIGPLTISNVRILTKTGRYVESAGSHAEIAAPPHPSEKIAGNVARQGAGIAAGQIIPYGGTLVSLVSSSATALYGQEQTDTKRAFALRRLKNVELDPGGSVSGSAYLPDIQNARFLVIDYATGGKDQRVKIPFANQRSE